MPRSQCSVRSALLVFILLLGSACGGPEPEQTEAIRPVKIFEVGSTDGSFSREWPGRVEPTQNARMSFVASGDLVELPVEEGMLVERGQLLARLDARQFRARLDSEQAQLHFNQTEFDRSSTLVESGAVALAELDRRTRALQVSKAAVAEAKKAIADTKLIAPFAGTIAKKMVDNFQSVQAQQPVLVLHDASSLEVVTHVSQRDYARAAPGLTIDQRNERADSRVHVTLDTQPDLQIPARLKEIASIPDPITGTYEVTWSFDPPEGLTITPGMTAKVSIAGISTHAGQADGIYVPLEAVVGSDDGGAHVWVIDPASMAVTQVVVEIGDMSGDSIEITAGLAGSELLATTGVHVLREGLVVSRFDDLYGGV